MSRHFDLWQKGSRPEPEPEPERRVVSQPVPARTTSEQLDQPMRHYVYREFDVEDESDGADWLQMINVLRKHWRWGLLAAILITAGAATYTMLLKPVYIPVARLQIDRPESVTVTPGRPVGEERQFLATQVVNLTSDQLALQVIHKLQLDKNSEFVGKITPSAGPVEPSTALAPRLTPEQEAALKTFSKARNVQNEVGSNIFSISVAAGDPVLAAQITNTLAETFIEDDLKRRDDDIAQWQRQLGDIKKRMDEANQALNRFERASGIGAIGENQNTFSNRVLELSKQLMQAQADRIQLEAYLEKLNTSQSTSLPQVSNDAVVQKLTAQLATAKSELAKTLTVYGANHPNAKKLQNEINELESQLHSQRSSILTNLETSYSVSKARERLLASQMAGATKQMTALAQYKALKKEADTNTQLYTVLYQKVKELAIAANTRSSSIRMVEQARVLNAPTKPDRLKYLAGSLVLGILGGLGLIFILENVDTRIRTPADMRSCLGADSVSVVPVIANGGARFSLASPGLKWLPGNSEESNPAFLLDRPDSPEAEAVRAIYTAVRLSARNSEGRAKVLMMTSPLPGEGKTTLTVNLALALAQQGTTCLVNADLRKKVGVHVGAAQMLNTNDGRGLSEVLCGEAELDDVIAVHSRVPMLSILQAGKADANPGPLLASNAMSNLIGELRQRYDFVVVDSPPILPFADARLLSVMVDGILLIGRAGVTRRENLKRAAEILRGVRSAPVLEYVLNASDEPAFNYGGYEYGYGKSATA